MTDQPDQITLLYAALAEAHADLTNPVKDKVANTPQFSYAYADLATVLDHVRPVLAKHGLALTQDVAIHEHSLDVTTRLVHKGGGALEFGPLTGPSGGSWQQLGSGITYARRYAILAALAIAADDDDDAQTAPASAPAASRTPNPRGLTGPARNDLVGKATEKQLGMVKGLMKEAHMTEVQLHEFAMERLGFELPPAGVAALTKGQASAIIDAMTKTPASRPATRTSSPPPEDPWASPPMVDPVTGEVAQ